MTDAVLHSTTPGSLLVFSDDWGRHPSSCQHLVGHLLHDYPVTWVNTIGMRTPRLDAATLRRVSEKLSQWMRPAPAQGKVSGETVRIPDTLKIVNPRMWPWFGGTGDRRLNQWLLSRQIIPLIKQMPQPVTALTTLPITADLAGVLPVNRWVYYCVDDFSQWPGLDGDTLRRMDADMVARADSLVVVSEHLQSMVRQQGRSASLLTHGVDTDLWRASNRECVSELPQSIRQTFESLAGPRVVFWGVIDRRMDTPALVQLSRDLISGTIVLIGPQQDPDPQILSLPNVMTLPPQPIQLLPQIAQQADALIMPYADLPVTRAMQPLKLKEYMATGKPVIVNRLPSTLEWSDCLETASSPEEFSQLVRHCLRFGVSPSQQKARSRLARESWSSKARILEQILIGCEKITGDEAALSALSSDRQMTSTRSELAEDSSRKSIFSEMSSLT